MKSLLKFALLFALIISGKLAKPSVPAAMAQTAEINVAPTAPVILVHQVLTSEPVKTPGSKAILQPNGSVLLAEMF